MNKTDNPRRALGKGLSALLPTRPRRPGARRAAIPDETSQTVPIDSIDPNPLQPRRVFNSERLSELAQSIRTNGIIQPLVVRKVGDRYQLVAGERRWRAAKLARVEQVPVVVRDIPDDRLLEITLVENIQREDLNPIETANAFARLGTRAAAEPGADRASAPAKTGPPSPTSSVCSNFRPTSSNWLPNAAFPPGTHAVCWACLPSICSAKSPRKSVAQGWSVRQMERTTQRMMEGRKPKHVDEVGTDPNVKAAIQEMERVLGTKVRIVEKAKQKGRIEIDYYSTEDLDRIYAAIVGEA